jgi:hypothetical protein
MKKVATDIYNSFFNNKEGFSARKLTAFSLMVCVAWLHYSHVTDANADTFLMYDLIAIFLLLGVITAQNIIHFKNGNPTETTLNQQ